MLSGAGPRPRPGSAGCGVRGAGRGRPLAAAGGDCGQASGAGAAAAAGPGRACSGSGRRGAPGAGRAAGAARGDMEEEGKKGKKVSLRGASSRRPGGGRAGPQTEAGGRRRGWGSGVEGNTGGSLGAARRSAGAGRGKVWLGEVRGGEF